MSEGFHTWSLGIVLDLLNGVFPLLFTLCHRCTIFLESILCLLVKLWLDGNVPTDVGSARHLIQGHRADTHHEDTLEVAFELLEYVTIETIGMGDGMIYLLAMLIEYDVCEVVVLIDDEVERIVVCLGSLEE